MEILEARDKRVSLIEEKLKKDVVVISLRCNYPGQNKVNSFTIKVINVINDVIEKKLSISNKEYICDAEGPIYLYEIKSNNPREVKLVTVNIENNHFLGRLVDIDVYYESSQSISRKDLFLEARRCFLCEDSAFNCIVHKRHKEEEIREYFRKTLKKFEQLPLDMIEYTNQAMLYELCLYPSFGLVSPYSQGSHNDMDHYTFIDSISVLNKYMYQFAKLGFQKRPILSLYDEAIRIGVECEKAMYRKTKGINTHKGLIFVLGTIVLCTMKTIYEGESFEEIFKNIALLSQNKLQELHVIDEKHLSHGENIYQKYQIGGVRLEASLGFPLIQQALQILDLNDLTSYLKTLVFIMSKCDDTTIIHRKGLDGLEYVKQVMHDVIAHDYDEFLIKKIDEKFVKEGISPGGSADLLSGTIFLSLIKNNIYKK
ncbi:MAG TPA: citrate lyase holo-[acyl-carrier protein] synthase [Haloplasmataceae bacterium]